MDLHARSSSSMQEGPSSQGSSSRSRTDPCNFAADAALQHKPSLANTRSTSSISASASSSSYSSYSNIAAEAAAAAAAATLSESPTSADTQPPRRPAHVEPVQSPKTRTFEKPKRLPVYIRIVPKDIWLRIHVDPSQTIASVKDTALLKANAPDHDPSLSYRFYQDAVNASAHAKIAPVASHDKVLKHRTYALPRSLACPPPDLTDVAASVAASVAGFTRLNKRPSRSQHSQPASFHAASPPPLPPLPNFDNAYSPRTDQVFLPTPASTVKPMPRTPSPRSHSIPLPVSALPNVGSSSSARLADGDDYIGSSSANFTRQTSTLTLATSPPSSSSDWGAPSNLAATLSSDASASDASHSLSQSQPQSLSHAPRANEVTIRLDAALITGNRNAKLEEHQATTSLSQWNALRRSTGASRATRIEATPSVVRPASSPTQSYHSTPTIGSSSTFDSEPAPCTDAAAASSSSLGVSSASGSAQSGYAASPCSESLHLTATTPPRRPHRLNPGTMRNQAAPPAIFYTQPGACDSFSSLGRLDSPSSSSAGLMTTQDDDLSIMQWGTQAEAAAPLSDDQLSPSASPSPSPSPAAAFPALSSPMQPSSEALISGSPASISSSAARPRSRTVTAADVLRMRRGKDETPPMMPDVVTSPARKSSLPRLPSRKMEAESSQRRDGPQLDLMDLLKNAPAGMDDIDDDDDGGNFSTVKQRALRPAIATPPALRQKSSGEAAATATVPSPPPPTSAVAYAAETRDRYLAGIRVDEISRRGIDATHPLSCKYAVLSSANGCELEEWKTVAAYRIRPYELLELQWSIPTERVYIPPISLSDTIRATRAKAAASSNNNNNNNNNKSMFDRTWAEDAGAGPDADALCLEPYFEGWIYALKGGAVPGKSVRSAKASTKVGKWKLHWVTVKGWRMDLYRKKPRAGEAVLPGAEQTWSLRLIDWVMVDPDNAVHSNAALPALDAMPRASLTVAFSPKGSATTGDTTSTEVSTLTLRCISHFDHEALLTLVLRAWYRCSAASMTTSWSSSVETDNWRRKAVFRAIVAGRGGTVAAGRVGRGGRGGRNAKARTRLRPSGWPKEWEDADLWSSDSEREEIAPPAELEHMLLTQQQQARRNTVTQAKADKSAQKRHKQQQQQQKDAADERRIVPNGLYAALSGRTTGTRGSADTSGGGAAAASSPTSDSSPYHEAGVATMRPGRLAQSVSLPHMEPGLLLGSHQFHHHPRRRSGSTSRSPDLDSPRSRASPEPRAARSSSARRGRSTPSAHSSPSSRNVSREASPMPSRKGSASGSSSGIVHHGDPYTSPAIQPGFVDLPPSPSVMLLMKFKANQQQQQQQQAKGGSSSRDDVTST